MNSFKMTVGAAVLSGLLTGSALAQCCGGESAGTQAGCNMAGPAAAPAEASATCHVFKEPVQAVFNGYITIQETLAQDSLEGVAGRAAAMAKAIQDDSAKGLPPQVAQQAEALAQAKDLKAARSAFKALSESLIAYVKSQKLPAGTYYEVYCGMAKAGWLQTGKIILNPYKGKEMIHCGHIQG